MEYEEHLKEQAFLQAEKQARENALWQEWQQEKVQKPAKITVKEEKEYDRQHIET